MVGWWLISVKESDSIIKGFGVCPECGTELCLTKSGAQIKMEMEKRGEYIGH